MYKLLQQKEINTEFGGKINALIQSQTLDVKVPEGLIIPRLQVQALWERNIDIQELMTYFNESDFDKETIEDQIKQALEKIEISDDIIKAIQNFIQDGQTYIVRSSGLLEDGLRASFAGQYQSILNNMTLQEILSAVKECIHSLFTYDLLVYWNQQQFILDDFGMAILIQEQVPSEISGLAFSLNPAEGRDDEYVIEYIDGPGSQLVEGQMSPYYLALKWEEPIEYQVYSGKLGYKWIKEIKNLLFNLTQTFSYPVDCELALYNNELYLLQVRPITGLSPQVSAGSWTTANFRDGGVASQDCPDLMWSLYRDART